MNLKKLLYILAGVIAVVIVASAAVVFTLRMGNKTGTGGQAVKNTYINYGAPEIMFDYPEQYQLVENGDKGIVLTEFQEVSSTTPSEGPTAITFDFYVASDTSAVDWVTNTVNSNYKLATGPYATTTIAGVEAVEYTWDGLYRGDSIVFFHNGYIIMASVTYMSPTDQIRKDFVAMISSLEFRNGVFPGQDEIVAEYVKSHIQELSYVKATLGGTYYVTSVHFPSRNSGVVEYEDGHMAHTARFEYRFNQDNKVDITSFVIDGNKD